MSLLGRARARPYTAFCKFDFTRPSAAPRQVGSPTMHCIRSYVAVVLRLWYLRRTSLSYIIGSLALIQSAKILERYLY